MQQIATGTEPAVTYRKWGYAYSRPRRMGWPNIKRTGWPAGQREDKYITPHKIHVNVQQREDGPPELSNISVSGVWAGTRHEVSMKIHHSGEVGPEMVLVIHAPAWVMDLAADAISRSSADSS